MSFVTGVRGRAGGKPVNNQQRRRYYMTDEQALQSIIERERQRGGVNVNTPGHEPGCPCNQCHVETGPMPEPLPVVLGQWSPDDKSDDDAGDGLTPLPVVG